MGRLRHWHPKQVQYHDRHVTESTRGWYGVEVKQHLSAHRSEAQLQSGDEGKQSKDLGDIASRA